MTKREALEIMLKQWDYIAMFGVSKDCANLKLKLPNMNFGCSCCEFAGHKGDWSGTNCPKCPVKWPIVKKYRNRSMIPCCKSYYIVWEYGVKNNYQIAKIWARKIANLALETLNKEYPEE